MLHFHEDRSDRADWRSMGSNTKALCRVATAHSPQLHLAIADGRLCVISVDFGTPASCPVTA
jgi:hypothetical protein